MRRLSTKNYMGTKLNKSGGLAKIKVDFFKTPSVFRKGLSPGNRLTISFFNPCYLESHSKKLLPLIEHSPIIDDPLALGQNLKAVTCNKYGVG